MQKNLHELEMKLAWLDTEREKLKAVIENQRGMLMQAERLLAPEIETVIAASNAPEPPPFGQP
jgi:hypothetical protein